LKKKIVEKPAAPTYLNTAIAGLEIAMGCWRGGVAGLGAPQSDLYTADGRPSLHGRDRRSTAFARLHLFPPPAGKRGRIQTDTI